MPGFTLVNDNFEFPDLLGAAYEYLIKYFADNAGKKGGQFYTPGQVVRLMVQLLKPSEGMSVYDPTAGSGGMLIQSSAWVGEQGGDGDNLELHGQENDGAVVSICKMNLILHNLTNSHLEFGDMLEEPLNVRHGQLRQFARVLANPPFSQNYTLARCHRQERFKYGFAPETGKKADLMFVQHMPASLKPTGRAAVGLPHGVLFRGGKEKEIRKGMLTDNGADFANQKVANIRRYISAKALKSTATNLIAEGDLLLVTRTGVGEMAIAPCDIAISQDITGITFDQTVADTEFMYYLLQGKTDHFLALNQGTSINGIIREDLLNLKIELPGRKEQAKIAKVLCKVDQAIEQTEALVAKYQRLKTGPMRDLLTRGIDEHGRLRDPATHKFKPSRLGPAPEEWQVSTLGSVCDFFSGGTPARNRIDWWNGSIPFLSAKDMKSFEILDTSEHVTPEAASIGSRVMPTSTVFILVRGMTLAHSFSVCISTQPLAFN